MKVRELIKNTVWLPSRDYDTALPKLSVLMPTFRRGSDGLFLRAARSILDQSLRDLELIVVDDGSTDGTAQQIEMLMATDERVSCLRHSTNIGLPAISEYEAFMRARGQLFAFGFDDFIFDLDAMSGLVAGSEASPGSAIHGFVEWIDAEGTERSYGKDPIPHQHLAFYNFLANASFLVPRVLLEDVGLYDPHIAATRLCDWDLWRRILRKYSICRLPILVGREYGVTRHDSLGNTFPLFEESMQQYFEADRNNALRPDTFADFDIWQVPPNSSALLVAHIFTLRAFFELRDWAHDVPPETAVEQRALLHPTKKIVGIFGSLAAIEQLALSGLHTCEGYSLLYIAPELSGARLYYALCACSAVILADKIANGPNDDVRAICTNLSIPLPNLSLGAQGFDIIAHCQPVNVLMWIARLRTVVLQSDDPLYVRNLRAAERDLAACEQRLKEMEAQINSRTFRLALKLRALSVWSRKLLALFRHEKFPP